MLFRSRMPAFSLTDLSEASGTITWNGHVALEIENSRINTALSLLHLQEVRGGGLRTTGRLDLSGGKVKGVLGALDRAQCAKAIDRNSG